MYDVIFYKDRTGNEPIKEYIYELKAKAATSKQDRIQFEKIMAYIGALQEYGTRIGQPQVKHILREVYGNCARSITVYFSFTGRIINSYYCTTS